MTAWKGMVARSFDVNSFDDYVVHEVVPRLTAWKPDFVVLHNTMIPRLTPGINASGEHDPGWHATSGDRRMVGLQSYYRDDQKWSGGPHLFVADDLIWAFTPLWVPGVHSPSWNDVSWGVEVVGDYDREEFSPSTFANVTNALATLHRTIGKSPDTLRFHKEDPATTHRGCPGVNIEKDEIVSMVKFLIGTT